MPQFVTITTTRWRWLQFTTVVIKLLVTRGAVEWVLQCEKTKVALFIVFIYKLSQATVCVGLPVIDFVIKFCILHVRINWLFIKHLS